MGILIVLVWLYIADFKNDWKEIKYNPVVWSILLFTLIYILGLLWTTNYETFSISTLQKESKLLFIPIFMLFTRKEHIKYYISAFLLAMSISEVASYAIYLEIIPPFHKATIYDPTPFLSHITYNPILAIAIYLLILEVLYNKEISKQKKLIYSLFILTMSVNMFVTGGRSGQVMFFAMILISIFQYFGKQIILSSVMTFIILPSIFFLMYSYSPIFHTRINKIGTETSSFLQHRQTANTSVGLRLNFAINSWEIIKKNILIGTGTGSFRAEYKKVNTRLTPKLPTTINPHNMYTFVLVELGLLGLISMLIIFISQVYFALKYNQGEMRLLGIGFPLLYMIVILGESYLFIQSTAFLFILLSSFIYKRYP